MDLLDILTCDDDEDNLLAEPEPKRHKYTNSLDGAIDKEILDQRKDGACKKATEIECHRGLIKRFLGSEILTFFEYDKNQKQSKVLEFLSNRIHETYDFTPYRSSDILSREECDWLSDYDVHIIRIVYRTFEQMSLDFKMYISTTFHEIYLQMYFKLKEERFHKNFNDRLRIGSEEIIANLNDLDITRDRDIREQTRKRIVDEVEAFSLTINDIESLFSSIPLGTFNIAQRLFDEGPQKQMRDDPEIISVDFNDNDMPNEPIPETEKNSSTDTRDQDPFQVTVQNNTPGRLKKHLKSIMKPAAFYYSDQDVYEMDIRTRKEYSKSYMRHKKKTVTFTSNPPECRIVIIHCVETMITAHKKSAGMHERLTFGYPIDAVDRFNVGEGFTGGFDVNYDTYRSTFHPNKRATATTHFSKKEKQKTPLPLKIVPMRSYSSRHASHVLPAHNELREKHPAPVIYQNSLLKSYYLKLVRYGNFWQPHKFKESAYNYCYGPMIISDALLEDADPDYLANTGLFAFPPPFSIKTIIAILEEITPREFDIRDVVLTWGFEKLVGDEKYESAVGELITAYQLIRKVLIMKYENLWQEGFNKLPLPTFWLITVPVVDSLKEKTLKYNEAVRCFTKMLKIGLIDWDAALQANDVYTNEHSAELQLTILYDEMKKKINITTFKTHDLKKRAADEGLIYSNTMRWKEQRRIETKGVSNNLDADTKPTSEELRQMSNAENN